jgi:transcription initiation factor TFIID TATA-box-binding protein
VSKGKNSLTYTIQNIVVRLSLNCNLNLEKIRDCFKNCSYDPNHFPGLFLRIKAPKSVLIIFRTGKIVLTGIKLFKDIDCILEYLILQFNQEKILQVDLIKDNFDVTIVNIVITADLNRKVDLDLASLSLNNAIYEPEVFPGLIYKHNEIIKSTFLIFSTGKLVFTGISQESLIEPSLISLGRLLKRKDLFKQ